MHLKDIDVLFVLAEELANVNLCLGRDQVSGLACHSFRNSGSRFLVHYYLRLLVICDHMSEM